MHVRLLFCTFFRVHLGLSLLLLCLTSLGSCIPCLLYSLTHRFSSQVVLSVEHLFLYCLTYCVALFCTLHKICVFWVQRFFRQCADLLHVWPSHVMVTDDTSNHKNTFPLNIEELPFFSEKACLFFSPFVEMSSATPFVSFFLQTEWAASWKHTHIFGHIHTWSLLHAHTPFPLWHKAWHCHKRDDTLVRVTAASTVGLPIISLCISLSLAFLL